MFHTDSAARTVYRFDLTDDGSIANKRAFIVFEQDWGYPDGMTVDAEGGLWIAHWGGGRVSRFDEQGRMERSIVLPASQTTNCCFAGQHLDRMFVTSAATGVDEAQGGALFESTLACAVCPPTSMPVERLNPVHIARAVASAPAPASRRNWPHAAGTTAPSYLPAMKSLTA